VDWNDQSSYYDNGDQRIPLLVSQNLTVQGVLYWQVPCRILPLLIPTWYTIFYINYIKLSSYTCFERNPLIFRRSMMLIVHVCSLWCSHSLQVAVLCTC
jgi:hypothetical protein